MSETTSQENGVKVEENDMVASIREDLKGLDPGKQTEYFEKKFEESPELLNEYLDDEEAFLKKYAPEEATSEDDGVAKSEQTDDEHKPEDEKESTFESHKPEEEEEIEITGLKIRPSWLGTYGKNRNPEDAILEALKGNSKKDEFIEQLRTKNIDLESQIGEMAKAQEEIKTLRKSVEDKKGASSKADLDKSIQFPEFGEDEDPYSDEYQKKVRDYMVATKQMIDSLKSENDNLKESITSEQNESSARRQREEEFAEIERIRRIDDSGVFQSKRKIEEIQADYERFADGLRNVSGINSPLYVSAGKFHPDVVKAWDLYHDPVNGKELKEKCDSYGVALPEDFSDLQTVYKVNAIRSQRAIRGADGTFKPISYDEAFKLYKNDDFNIQEIRHKENLNAHTAHQRAVDKRKNFAVETDTKNSAPDVTYNDTPQERQMVNDLIAKCKEETATGLERNRLRTLLKSAKFSDEEIKDLMYET